MTERQIATAVLLVVLIVLLAVSLVQPHLGELTIERLHLAAWVLGLVDALLVGVSFLASH